MKLNMRADLWGSSRITEPTDRRVSLASFLLAFKAGRVKFRIVGDGVVTWEIEYAGGNVPGPFDRALTDR